MTINQFQGFQEQCKKHLLTVPSKEYRFHPVRRWRFDYAFTEEHIAVEIEGGTFIRGRHTRGIGAIADMEKYNTATALGWKVLRFTPKQIQSGEAVLFLRKNWKELSSKETEVSNPVQIA